MSKSNNEEDKFIPREIDNTKRLKGTNVNFNELYERTIAELSLQQTKRDQIITLYLAIFSFLIPFSLSIDLISWQIKGLIFLATAIIGILFSLVIIRYRIYKEAYWLCCQTITAIFNFKPEELDKDTVQAIYYNTIKKKGKSCFKEGTEEFSKFKYVSKNLFSSESIHFFIQAFITSLISGLSVGLIIECGYINKIIAGIVAGLMVFLLLVWKYFRECIKVYGVLIDGKKSSFNFAYSKAWFLHFYI